MYKSLSLCLLFVAILFGYALANAEQDSSTVSVHIYEASSIWWIAVQPRNDNGETTKIEMKDASSNTYSTLIGNSDWGYYSISSFSEYGFTTPLTFILTDASGSSITLEVSSIVPDALVDTGLSFSSSSLSSQIVNSAPTQEVTSSSSSSSSSSFEVTTAPTQKAASVLTSSSDLSATDLCEETTEPLKIIVPLYSYPSSAWDELITAASTVKILAIINPSSGPLPTVDSVFSSYMQKLADAGVDMVGYVYTSYGTRSVSDIEDDIDMYVANWPLLKGVFLDEGSSLASDLPFYTTIYNYIISKNYEHVIINPGAQPDEGYLAVSTNLMIYENYGSSLIDTSYSSWVTCAASSSEKTDYKYRFSGVAHTTPSSDVTSYVNSFAARGFGYVYVTDASGGCCTYNTLTSYFSQLASAVAALNAQAK